MSGKSDSNSPFSNIPKKKHGRRQNQIVVTRKVKPGTMLAGGAVAQPQRPVVPAR